MKSIKSETKETVRYIAESTGWSDGTSWFTVYELSYETEGAALDAISRHKKSFHGKIQYRLIKITTIREQLKIK